MTLCNEINCKSRAYYGIKYKSPLKCSVHRKLNMINVMDTYCLKCFFRSIETKDNCSVTNEDPVVCFRCAIKNIGSLLDKPRDR